MATPPVYPYSVLSVSDVNTRPPPLGDLDINRTIVAGTPINANDLRNAETIVEEVRSKYDAGHQEVTPEVVESAEFHYEAVRSSHITATYIPDFPTLTTITQHFEQMEDRIVRRIVDRIEKAEDKFDTQINDMKGRITRLEDRVEQCFDRFDEADERFDKLESYIFQVRDELADHIHDAEERSEARVKARMANRRIRQQNQQLLELNPKLPQKTVLGEGSSDYINKILNPSDYDGIALPKSYIGIGDVLAMSPNFRVLSCTKLDIAKIVHFYNEDLGIMSEDRHNLDVLRFKLIKWLTSD